MGVDVSIIIPCLNEEKTIGECVQKAQQACKKLRITYEIIVIDNQSTDQSAKNARQAGAKVILETRKGYGAAYKAGIKNAKGTYLFMADGDGTYDFSAIKQFYYYAKERKYEFVIGNRLSKHLPKTTMPFLHQYLGNPVLSTTLQLLFKSKVKDAHCGMRLITKKAIERMRLTSSGMEFASEMVIKAAKLRLRTKQLPITYHPRTTPSKLHSFRDGWRHLRFMLIFSPITIFVVPGVILSILGLFAMMLLLQGPIQLGTLSLGTHPLLLGSLFFIMGNQLILSGYFLRVLAVNYFQENDSFIRKLQKKITFEKGLLIGGVTMLIASSTGLFIIQQWIQTGFGQLNINIGIVAVTLCMAGIQLILNSFYYISIQALTESKEKEQ